MDVGCGPGDVTCQILKPMLPDSYQKMIAVDVSENMIRDASEKYVDPKLEFQVMDIGGEIPREFVGGFDHVFSLHCLQYIQDQK